LNFFVLTFGYSSYHQRILELLTNLKNVEESLKRLQQKKSSKKGTAGGYDVDMSDEDKIRLQIQLDVAQFGAEVGCWRLSASKD
jgi:hypothetical protein